MPPSPPRHRPSLFPGWGWRGFGLFCLPSYAAGRHARATPGGFTRHHTRTDGTRNSTALARRTHAPPPLRERIERTHHAQAPHARPSPRTIHRERCRHARPLRAHTAPDPANSTWHAATSAINHHAAPPFRRIAPPHTQRTLIPSLEMRRATSAVVRYRAAARTGL